LALLSAFCNGCSAVAPASGQHRCTRPTRGVVKVAWFLIAKPLLALGGAFLVGTLLFSAGAHLFRHVGRRAALLVTELVFTLGLRQVWSTTVSRVGPWLARPAYLRRPRGFLVIGPTEGGSRVPTSACGWWWVFHPCCGGRDPFGLRTRGPRHAVAALYGAAPGSVCVGWTLPSDACKRTNLLAAQGWLAPLPRALAP